MLAVTERWTKSKKLGQRVDRSRIEGPCPIVLCGAGAKAKRPFLENTQLTNRTIDWVEVKPFDIRNAADRTGFKQLFQRYFQEMSKRAIIDDGALLRSGDFFQAFFRASEGRPGEAVRIIEGAVAEMVRAGRASFLIEDFHKSTERLALSIEHNTETPFAPLLAG